MILHPLAYGRPVWASVIGSACLVLLAQPPRTHADDSPAKVAAAKGFQVQVVRDVAYRDLAPGEEARRNKNKLDLYLPRGEKGFPVLLFIHGGAWVHGDKNQFGLYSTFANHWAHYGVGVVVANYRLSPGVKHPEHVKDVAKALAWTHKNISKYGGRSDQIFLNGHSAGGHLVALLATDYSYLKAEGVPPQAIKGVMPISGVYRIHNIELNAGLVPDSADKERTARRLRMGAALVNSIFGSDSASRKAASPLTYVRPGLPPFLVIHADNDLPLLGAMAQEFAAALKGKGCEVCTLEVAHRSHMSVFLKASKDDDPAGKGMLEFMEKHTGKPLVLRRGP
jgi:acetyl esterase/lipase